MKSLKILHLYPDRMNIYGDFGNIICLSKRIEWRDLRYEYVAKSIGDRLTEKYDIIFMGGGQDTGQIAVAEDLMIKAGILKEHIESGVPVLAVCGAYQLFGKYFITSDNVEVPGINVFNVVTKATESRMIGNVVLQSDDFGEMVGFENHSGATDLLGATIPLGRVIKGYGNNLSRQFEGARYKNAIGTYLHGSFLPKNPVVADYIIEQALRLQDSSFVIKPIDDWLENEASSIAKSITRNS